MSLDDIQVDEHLNYIEKLVAILERKIKVMHNKEIPLVKVQWQHRTEGIRVDLGAEAKIRDHYPELFTAAGFEDKA